MLRRCCGVALVCAAATGALAAPTFVDVDKRVRVDAKRGADPKVDYASLVRFGPWDDRNYALTAADLKVLAPNEAELKDPIPAFFRVKMRQAMPDMPRSGPAQYPRHAYPIFEQMFGGYLVNGTVFPHVRRVGTRYAIVLEEGHAPGSDEPEPDFVSGEIRISNPTGGAESAVKVHPTDTNKVIAGVNGSGAGQVMYYSTNGGTVWNKVFLPLGGTGGDPAVDWSSDGTYAYTTTLGSCGFNGCKVWFYRSNDGGATWNGLESVTPGSPRRDLTTGGSDKEYIHVDKYPGSPYKDHIYLTWHDNNVMKFAVSADLGNTFAKQAFSSLSAELGIGSDITTGKNGEIYYLWPAFNSKTIRMKKSTDGGLTFGNSVVVASTQAAFTFAIPSIETRDVFVYTSADVDLSNGPFAGSVYVAWTDSTAPTSNTASLNHARIQVARSRDFGATWQVTTPHETADAATVDRWHSWLAVGPDGTVHVIYYDTRRSPDRTGVDLFYSYSTDGAVTWSAPSRVTTVVSPNITDSFEFGDYNGLDNVLNSLIAVFTDNRDETGGGARSVDVYGAGITPGGAAVCGDATIEPSEACDGTNVGGQTCSSIGCLNGILKCAGNCATLDTSSCNGCLGAGAGRVPDGDLVAGTPLHVDKSGTDLALSWTTACGPAVDYAVYEGQLGVAGSLVPRLCSTGGATSTVLTPSAGDLYYLVVPTSGGNEGSYGRMTGGTERAPSASACLPQLISGCP